MYQGRIQSKILEGVQNFQGGALLHSILENFRLRRANLTIARRRGNFLKDCMC